VAYCVIGEIVAECFVKSIFNLAHLFFGRSSCCVNANPMAANVHLHTVILLNLFEPRIDFRRNSLWRRIGGKYYGWVRWSFVRWQRSNRPTKIVE
jgi:hypothetical protein